MKRKITELEKTLLENSYVLVAKQYSGKHSEKTQCYIYQNGNNAIKIDYTRTKVLDFSIGVVNGIIDKSALLVLNTKFKALNEFVASILPQTTEKGLKSPILEEDSETLSNANGKTFEQLDEENQEIESEKNRNGTD